MRAHLRGLVWLLPCLQLPRVSDAVRMKVGRQIGGDYSKNAVTATADSFSRSSSRKTSLSQPDAGSASLLFGESGKALDDVYTQGHWRATYLPPKPQIDSFRDNFSYDEDQLILYVTDKTFIKDLLSELNRYYNRIAQLLHELIDPMTQPSTPGPGLGTTTTGNILGVEPSSRSLKTGDLVEDLHSLYIDHTFLSTALETPPKNADILAGLKKCLRQIRFPHARDKAFSLDHTHNIRAPFETKVFQAVELMYQSDLISANQMIDFFSDNQILEITARHLPIKLDLKYSTSWKGFSFDIDSLETDVRYSHLKWCLRDLPEDIQMRITWLAYKSAAEIFKSLCRHSFNTDFEKRLNLFIHPDFLENLGLSQKEPKNVALSYTRTSGQAFGISRQGSSISRHQSYSSKRRFHSPRQGFHISIHGSQISGEGSDVSRPSFFANEEQHARKRIKIVVKHFKEFWGNFINHLYQRGFIKSQQPTPESISQMKADLEKFVDDSRNLGLPARSKVPVYERVMMKRFEDSMNFNIYKFLDTYWKSKPDSFDSIV